MVVCKRFLVFFLFCVVLGHAQGNTFTKVRYDGGALASNVDPKDWNNRLTVTPDAITLVTKDYVTVEISPKAVTTLSYGQEAHRRVGMMAHKARLHYIGIQYNTAEGKEEGILLQGDKDNYRAMLIALQGVCGTPISVSEKDKEFVPGGISTRVVKDAEIKGSGHAAGAASHGAASSDPDAMGTVSVSTIPDGAEIYVDDQLYGNGPGTVKLRPGKHTIRVSLSGYKDWSKEVTTEPGSEAHLNATLEKSE
jgi:hypothetical protein